MQAAMVDPDVQAIMLQIDSPGGPCSGMFELADVIFAMRGRKPVWALVDDVACSAAYAIASAADHVVGGAICSVGSIGVFALCEDISKALDAEGVKIKMLSYGDAKPDGWPYAPTTRQAAARMQVRINTLGDAFVATVARHRSMKPADVKGTQADQFLGEAAVERGLIDAVMSRDQAFAALLAKVGTPARPAASARALAPPTRALAPAAACSPARPPAAPITRKWASRTAPVGTPQQPERPASAGWAEALERHAPRR